MLSTGGDEGIDDILAMLSTNNKDVDDILAMLSLRIWELMVY